MATAKIIFDTRTPSKSGKYPVVVRIYHKQQFLPIGTKVSCLPAEWDSEKLKVLKSPNIQNAPRLNSIIYGILLEAESFIADHATTLNKMSCRGLRDQIRDKYFGAKEGDGGGTATKTLQEYIKKHAADLVKAKRVKYSISFTSILNSLVRYDKKVDFQDLNVNYLRAYQNWMLSEGMTYGGIAVYMRTLRRICNLAISDKIMGRDWYPFYEFRIKKTKTAKRAIGKGDLDKIRNLRPEPNTTLWHHWNYFRFYFNARGMNFIDLAFLTKAQVGNDRLNYTRKKTNKPYSIALTGEMKTILGGYLKGKKANDFVFPIIIPETDPVKLRAQYEDQLKRHTHYLNELAKMAGVTTRITTYVIRHSWATGMRNSGAPISAIKEGMGHENLAVTETYLAEIGSEAVDEWNEKFMGG